MRRMVRYKKRKRREEGKVSPIKKINHQYREYLKEMEENPGIRVVEMDTVIGTKGGKVLPTIYWREEKLMLALLLENKGMSGTVGSFDSLMQEKLDLMMSHINSTARPSLQGGTPIQLALQHFGKDTVEKLGLQFIQADDLCLKPELLK